MRLRELGLALAALCSGCSADADSQGVDRFPRNLFWGGQTGSLTPQCGVAPAEAIPEGSSGIVVDTRACARVPSGSEVLLTTEAGESIDSEWIPLGNGRYLVRPAQSLARGQYRISVAGSSQAIQVGASSPKPRTLGVLAERTPTHCSLDLELRLDDAVLPYAPLLRVGIVRNGFEELSAEYGQLGSDDGTLYVQCNDCVRGGRSEVQAVGEIAGEAVTLETAPLTIDSACPSPSGDEAGCGVAPAPRPGWGELGASLLLGMLVVLRRARLGKTGGS